MNSTLNYDHIMKYYYYSSDSLTMPMLTAASKVILLYPVVPKQSFVIIALWSILYIIMPIFIIVPIND
jgi:hypothetical protein